MLSMNDVVVLVSYEPGTKVNGITAKGKRIEKEVFANIASTKRTEFYQALKNGIKSDYTITVNKLDYNGQKKVVFDDREFTVVREWIKSEYYTELTLSEVI